jgi:hypothetical protein
MCVSFVSIRVVRLRVVRVTSLLTIVVDVGAQTPTTPPPRSSPISAKVDAVVVIVVGVAMHEIGGVSSDGGCGGVGGVGGDITADGVAQTIAFFVDSI